MRWVVPHDYIEVSSAGKKTVDTLNTIPALRSTHSAFDDFQGKHLYHSSPSPERLTINTKHISNLNAFSPLNSNRRYRLLTTTCVF